MAGHILGRALLGICITGLIAAGVLSFVMLGPSLPTLRAWRRPLSLLHDFAGWAAALPHRFFSTPLSILLLLASAACAVASLAVATAALADCVPVGGTSGRLAPLLTYTIAGLPA